MIQPCGICHTSGSKYKCPTCSVRYCSIACYKPHKQFHLDTQAPSHNNSSDLLSMPVQQPQDRPGTKQRVPKTDITGLENDAQFQRLFKRYPLLKLQLQAVYALTLEPSLEEERTWHRQPLPGIRPTAPISRRGNFRGRQIGRGRGRGKDERGRFVVRGGSNEGTEERQHGPWTREKGDKEALTVIKTMSEGDEDDGRAEGMKEFVELCVLRFGKGRAEGVEQGSYGAVP